MALTTLALTFALTQNKRDLVARGGGSEETERAVFNGLRWLAKHQNEDGSWTATGYLDRCKLLCDPHGVDESAADRTVGLTAAGLLAFLGAGYTHSAAAAFDGIVFGDVVRKAATYLIGRQAESGLVGDGALLDHAAAALALCEHYGLTGSNKLKAPAQKAIDSLVEQREDGGGWGGTLETAMAVAALKSADLSGLNFDRNVAYDGAPEALDGGEPADAMSAALSVVSRISIDKRKSTDPVRRGTDLLTANLPDAEKVDYAYWYWGSLSLFQYDGPKWKRWNRAMVDALVKRQNRDAEFERYGSWEPDGRWCGEAGGRVYATAVSVLTLEVYYRYASVFGK